MQNWKRKNAGEETAKRYKPPPAGRPPPYHVEIICPICDRRAFNLSEIPQDRLWVGLKCPNCHKIINVLCALMETIEYRHTS